MILSQRNKIIIGILILVVVAVLALVGWRSYTTRNVVARVNKDTITKDELYNYLIQHGGKSVLDQLISEKVVDQEASKQNVSVSDEEVNAQLDKLIASYGGAQAFDEALNSSGGYTMDDVKKEITMKLKVKKLMEPTITITEDEMKKYFEDNKTMFDQAEQVKVRHILVVDENQAKEVKTKLDAGGDFAELAKTYSTDFGTKDAGGELGYVGRGSLVKEFEDVAFSLKVGETSGPVKTDYGYHIIQVEDKKPAKAADYESSKEQIKDQILEQKVNEGYDAWMQSKSEELKVVNYLK